MRNARIIRRALPAAVLTVSAVSTFVALGGVGGTVWGSGLKSRHRFIPVASLPPPDFVLRFYRDTSRIGTAPGNGTALVLNRPAVAIAEHTLTFHSGDPDELANVMRAVESMDGAVILPGATFSFNETVGERTEERGFRPGLMYMSGRLVSGIGGGVCIPSTGLYNAALKADLEIVERYNHSGPVSYAEPGLDAAVAFGYKDFRFRNNTDGPLAIRAGVEGDTLTVTLMARKATGRRVVLETTDGGRLDFTEETVLDPETPEGEPVVEQEGRAGFVVTVVRTVYQGDKLLRRETVSRDVVAARNRIVRMHPLDDPTSEEALAKAAEVAKAEELVKAAVPVAGEAAPVAPEQPAGKVVADPVKPLIAPQPAPKEHRESAPVLSRPTPKPDPEPKPVKVLPKVEPKLAPKPEPRAQVEPTPGTVPAPAVAPAPSVAPPEAKAAVTEEPPAE